MSIQACADLVARGDPDRFRAAMAAPVPARQVLFPIYAFAVEVSRAPWVTQEPMIAEMRLQWWRDVCDEIEAGKPARAHEVVGPLSEILTPSGAKALDQLVAMRRWDIYKDPFEDADHFRAYLTATGGGILWASLSALGADDSLKPAVDRFGYALALSRFLVAVPELEARGRVPLVDGRATSVADLAQSALTELHSARQDLRRAPKAPLIEAWMAAPILKLAAMHPASVAEGRLHFSELCRAWRMLRAVYGVL
jgi:phytoene synthase